MTRVEAERIILDALSGWRTRRRKLAEIRAGVASRYRECDDLTAVLTALERLEREAEEMVGALTKDAAAIRSKFRDGRQAEGAAYVRRVEANEPRACDALLALAHRLLGEVSANMAAPAALPPPCATITPGRGA